MWVNSAWWAQGTHPTEPGPPAVAAGEVVCEQLTGDWVTLFMGFGFKLKGLFSFSLLSWKSLLCHEG